MIEDASRGGPVSPVAPVSPVVVALGAVAASLEALAGADAVELVDLLEGLERLKGAAAARQAEVTAELDEIRAEAAAAVGRRASEGGLVAEVALARRESPHRGRVHLRLARALTRDLPHTLGLLRAGEISERRAEIVAVESAHLTREQRLVLDARLADRLPGLGEAETTNAVRRVVLRLDEAGWLARRSRALAGRRVTTRHLGEGMSTLTALLPSEVVTAASQALRAAAERHLATCEHTGEPDERTRTQLVADLAAERLGGSGFGAAGSPVAVKLVISAEALLGAGPGAAEPALLPGYGYLPASVARSLVTRGLSHHLSTARRVFAFPETTNDAAPGTGGLTGGLVAMEADTRLLTGLLRELVLDVRDAGTCRTPWCNAPAVHADHVRAARAGGQTSAVNGQGLCAGCNYAKETPGFRHEADLDDRYHHVVEVTTPTGHRHRSHAPPLPTPPKHTGPGITSPLEDALLDVVWTARLDRAS